MKYLKVNNFILKLIAIITMTIDHIGMFLCMNYVTSTTQYLVGYVFRCIGRLALPLFCFMIVEGALHTKNWKKYALRLTAILVPVMLFQIIAIYGIKEVIPFGNIFIDLLLGLLMITAFESKKKSVNLLGFLPLLYGFLCFIAFAYEAYNRVSINWFPYFLRNQYHIMSMGLMFLIYWGYRLVNRIYKDYGLDPTLQSEEARYRFVKNCVAVLALVIVGFADYAIHYINANIVFWDYNIQWMMIGSALPLFFYNGRRGYNATWFKVFAYFYYPVHLAIIYLIFLVI